MTDPIFSSTPRDDNKRELFCQHARDDGAICYVALDIGDVIIRICEYCEAIFNHALFTARVAKVVIGIEQQQEQAKHVHEHAWSEPRPINVMQAEIKCLSCGESKIVSRYNDVTEAVMAIVNK